MAEIIKDIEGSVVTSYYDTDYIRSLYLDFEYYTKNVKKHIQKSEKKDDVTELLLVKNSQWSNKIKSKAIDLFEDI